MTLDQKTHQRLFRSVAPVPEPYQAETVAAWRFRLLGGLVCLLSLAAGLYELGRPSVWFDEAASWAITNGNWKEYWILTTGGDDCGGFIYTLLLRFWTACAGKSEIALRLPSVLAATAFTGVMLMVGRSLWGRAAGLAVGLLAALHPQVIAWSRQARAYSPELLATALCVAAVLAYSRSGRRRDGWLLAGAVFLVVALHTFGTFVAAGVLLFLVSRRLGPGQAEEDGAPAALHLWPTFPALLFAVIWHMLMIPRIRANLVHFWTEGTILENYALVLRTHLPLWPAYGGLLAAGLAVLVHARRQQRNRTVLVLLACLALPILGGPVLASLPGKHHFIAARYFLPAIVLFILPVGYLLSRLPSLLAAPAVLGLAAVVFTTYTLPGAYGEVALDGSNARRTAGYLKSEMRGTDQLVIYPGYEWITLRYYGLAGQFHLTGEPQKLGSILAEAARAAPGGRTWLMLQMSDEHREALHLPAARVEQFGNLSVLRAETPSP